MHVKTTLSRLIDALPSLSEARVALPSNNFSSGRLKRSGKQTLQGEEVGESNGQKPTRLIEASPIAKSF